MKILLIAIINFLFFCYNLSAQDKMLIAEGTSPNLYLTHVVSAKENFYSIGRLYNVSPKEIAPYNNLALEKGLSLGQTIKIPLTPTNFLQPDAVNEIAMEPVYHIVEAKEGLYHVSTTYNKVPANLLKKWNNLQTDVVNNGTKLIVGYLNVNNQLLPPKKAVNATAIDVTKAKEENKIKTDPPKEKEEVVKNIYPEKKSDTNLQYGKTAAKEAPKQITEQVVFNKSKIDFNGGAFKSLYENQGRKKTAVTESGIAGIFKSTSGWQDGKYYCFHNSAAPGTIIKITNPSTGKSVYAKVLDLIPDIKQNTGLILHLSNAAAEELGAGENEFDCSISYAK